MLDETEPLPAAPADDRIPWGPREIAQVLGIVVAGFIFTAGVAALVRAAANLQLSHAQVLGVSLVGTFFLDFGLFGLAVGFSVRRYRLPGSALGFRPLLLDRAWVIVATVVGMFVVVGVYAVIVQLVGADKLLPESALGADVFDNRALVVMAGVLAVVTAPVAEETFFRGFLFGGLVKRLGIFWAALASGLLFSLAHAQPTTLIPFTFAGMLLAWSYAYTGSIWTNIAAHLTFNLIGFSVALAGW
jgi:membrane protease YdiL (CAAX protease family)